MSVVKFLSSVVAIGATLVLAIYKYKTRSFMDVNVPKDMNALLVTEPKPRGRLTEVRTSVERIPVPVPQKGQVLIKVHAAPVNPSDFAPFFNTESKSSQQLGSEGSGIVVGSGGGCFAKMGKRVAFVKNTPGSWAEYVVCDARSSFALPDAVDVADACSYVVNPFTAIAFLEIGKKAKSPIINGAAASALGKMLIRIAGKENVEVINIVRREEQVKTLKEMGARYVLNLSANDFQDQLKKLVSELKCTIAFDPLAGEMTGLLVRTMPPNSTIYVYGGLEGKPISGIDPTDLIYRGKKVVGFYMGSWIKTCGLRTLLRVIGKVKHSLTGDMKTEYRDTNLKNVFEDIVKMNQGELAATGNKLRIRFN